VSEDDAIAVWFNAAHLKVEDAAALHCAPNPKVIMPNDLQADVDAVTRIEAVPTILEVVCRTTGMGFAAVALSPEVRARTRRDCVRCI
jgi:hypothetical protein